MSVTTKKKHVERELVEDFTSLEENQDIVRVVRPRGNNLHQVVTPKGEEFLVSMPHKFRKHVWIKRGDFVVAEAIPEGNKVRAEIVRILLKDHIRHLAQNNMWPEAFAQHINYGKKEHNLATSQKELRAENNSSCDSESEEDGKVLMENPNRRKVFVQDSSESESDSSEEESDEGDDNDAESDSHELMTKR